MSLVFLNSKGMFLISRLLYIIISIFSSNFQGYSSVIFPHIFREYNMEYKSDIVNLLKTRVSRPKADKIIAKLGFQYSHHVEAIG